MLKLFIFLFIVFLFPLAQAADEGELAPPFQAKLKNGESFTFNQNDHQVVIIHFFATWCSTCLVEMPLFNDYYEKHRSEGLRFIAISMDLTQDEAKATTMMQKFTFPFAFARDAQFKKYGRIWRLPLTFIIDRKGILQKDGWPLDHPLTLDDLDKTIKPLLAQ